MRGLNVAVGMAALALAVNAGAVRGQGDAEAAAAFDEAYEVFTRAYREGDAAAVAALYAEDAFYLAPGDSIQRGDVVRHFAFLSSFEAGNGPLIDFEIVDREVQGDLAYDIGYFTFRRPDAPEGSGGRGKFIVIWKRDASGAWKIHADGYSEVRGPEGEGQ